MKINEMKLTPEIEKRLREYAPINPDAIFDYIPEAYRELPIEVQPIFKLRGLSGVEVARAQDAMRGSYDMTSSQVKVNQGEFTIIVCKDGIVHWENYQDMKTGEEIKYAPTLAAIPKELLYELANAILRNGALSEDEVLGLGF